LTTIRADGAAGLTGVRQVGRQRADADQIGGVAGRTGAAGLIGRAARAARAACARAAARAAGAAGAPMSAGAVAARRKQEPGCATEPLTHVCRSHEHAFRSGFDTAPAALSMSTPTR